jgi:hypothetical protein
MRIIVFAFRPKTKQVNFTASPYCIQFTMFDVQCHIFQYIYSKPCFNVYSKISIINYQGE